MLDALKKESNITYTENGALSNYSTNSDCLNFFAVAGALRGEREEDVIDYFIRAYGECPDYAMRILFYARDVRGGLGERRLFRLIIRWLADNFPESIRKNIDRIAEYGRYDDIIELLDTQCEYSLMEYIKGQLDKDILSMQKGEGVSLLAKWLPSVNATNKQRKLQAKKIAKNLKMTEKQYRQTLSKLKAYIDILESRLCKKDYTFDYEKQPSKAMFKYRKAFLRNDKERYINYIERVNEGKAKMNTGVIYPYEIVAEVLKDEYSENDVRVLDTTWRTLPNYCDDRNAIAVVDGSGSMYCNNGQPISVAMALGIYFAEHNTGYFHNHFITFSESPRLVEIKGDDIFSKVKYCMTYAEIANTDLYKVYELILNSAIKNNLSQSELPETIYIISDMEFDMGVCDDKTLFQEVKKLYAVNGYKLPTVVYWNVCSRNHQYSVVENDEGAVLVSGMSPNVFKMVVSQKVTPYDFMISVINSERYINICA